MGLNTNKISINRVTEAFGGITNTTVSFESTEESMDELQDRAYRLLGMLDDSVDMEPLRRQKESQLKFMKSNG
jgi:hypothetical protein